MLSWSAPALASRKTHGVPRRTNSAVCTNRMRTLRWPLRLPCEAKQHEPPSKSTYDRLTPATKPPSTVTGCIYDRVGNHAREHSLTHLAAFLSKRVTLILLVVAAVAAVAAGLQQLLPIPRAPGSSGFESAVPSRGVGALPEGMAWGRERRRSVHLSACVRNTRRARIGSSEPLWVRNTTGSRSAAFGRNCAARLTMPL